MADGSLIFDTKLDASGLSTGLGKLGGVAGTAFKGVAVAVGAAATAIGVLTKSALDGYASYEQLTGGVETLFKDSAGEIMQYAENAYKTAGLSANQYMETVTSFSASLIQSVGGDTAEAAKIADVAITDMSDNANKMGTSIDMIQNAYQGFAKQNYTMLDNLKLGYGGTKEEMQRLIDDANKVKEANGEMADLSIDSFADVTEAIHVMQTEMGIAGATAAEASTTIKGSIGAMKAAWSNLVVGLADENADLDALINQFVDSVKTVGENVLPVVETILGGIGDLIQTMLPVIVELLPGIINDTLPQLLDAGVALVDSLISGITSNMGSLIDTALNLALQLVDVILSNLPALIEVGMQVIVQLILGIAEAIPTLIPSIVDVVLTIVDTLIANIGLLVNAAITIMFALAEGMIAALPQLIERVPEIIDALLNAIVENAPLLVEASLQLIITLATALITYLPQLLAKVPMIMESLLNAFIALVGEFVAIGSEVVNTIKNAISSFWSNVTGAVSGWMNNLKSGFIAAVANFIAIGSEVVNTIKSAIANAWSTVTGAVSGWMNDLSAKFITAVSNFSSIGQNIVNGIWSGISAGWSWLTGQVSSLASDLFNAAKEALGIASPSKKFKYIGEMCVAGFDDGVEDLMSGDAITKGINASLGTVVANTSAARSSVVGGFNQTINVNKEISTPDELARVIRLESKYGLMKGVAFA